MTSPAAADSPCKSGCRGPSTKAFATTSDRMHKDMKIDFGGDADIDFMRDMIPQRQRAIDMANVVLEYGEDPQVRKLPRRGDQGPASRDRHHEGMARRARPVTTGGGSQEPPLAKEGVQAPKEG